MKQEQPWATKLVKGEPIRVGGREFVPIVRVRSMLRRRVTFGTKASQGSGGGVVWMRPIAVMERQFDGTERRIPIPDATGTILTGMVVGALVLPLLYLVVALTAFLWRRRQSGGVETECPAGAAE